jgi:putative FmdB family regulatory protein
MPLYAYKCTDCKRTFEVRHGMFFEDQKCTHCFSLDIFRLPSLSSRKSAVTSPDKVGKVVDKYIADVKEELKQERKTLKEEEL